MIDKVTVKIINKSNNDLPQYSTPSAAGMDLRANLSEAVTLSPLERKLIPTGIFIELPEGYECQIRPRSGLALKHGISVLNSPGTIDADYRGEIGVILANLSNDRLLSTRASASAKWLWPGIPPLSGKLPTPSPTANAAPVASDTLA